MEALQNQISELKAGRTLAELKKQEPKTYYRVKGLSSKLSELKAEEKGNFITKGHLTEYKGLIIWILRNKTNYRGYLNLKEAMVILLEDVQSKNIVFKTAKSVKGIVCSLAIRAGLETSEKNLREANGLTVLDNTCGNRLLEDFGQFKLRALMN